MSDSPTVFIVDDDTAAAESVAALLASVNLPFQIYRTAEDFLSHFRDSQRGCLVLDIRLPGMSGLELYQLLQDRELKIPTIFISGHMDADACQQAMHEGALACLEKPYTGDDLCQMIQNALQNS